MGEIGEVKQNIIGIIGAILGFISLALPWWTVSMSASSYGYSYSLDVSAYLFQVTALGQSAALGSEYWFGWVALALVIVGSIVTLVGSIAAKRRSLIAIGGVLALVGVIVFPLGLQLNIASALGGTSSAPSGIGVFSSGSYSGASYSSYLTFGFWIALVAAIMMLVATKRKPAVTIPLPPPPPPAVV